MKKLSADLEIKQLEEERLLLEEELEGDEENEYS